MSSPSTSKRQRVDLTGSEKRKICEVHMKNPSLTHLALAKFMVEHHGYRLVDRTTISKILEHSNRWLEVQPDAHEGKTRRVRDAKYPQVDKALMLWFGQIRAKRGIINDAMLLQKAAEFRDAFGISEEDLKLSPGWLGKFKSRHGIACHNLRGESSYVDAHGVGISQAKLPAIIAAYDPEDVFNFDEMGLYYRAPPSKTLSAKNIKDRITLGLCANTTGKERLKMVFIHKSARPRCFPEAFNPNVLVHYCFNATAWMNGDIFTNWVTGENRRMVAKGRKILILLDNAASHKVEGVQRIMISGFDAFVLSNITLLYFPVNVSSVVQPLNQGVMAALKVQYKRKLVTWTLQQYSDVGGIHADLLQCMIWAAATWNEMDDEIIRDAWRASNILPQGWNTDIQNSLRSRMNEDVAELEKLITALHLGITYDGNPVPKLLAAEYLDMSDEDVTEAEYSTSQIVDLIENGEISVQCLVGEDHGEDEDPADETTDKNDMERMTVNLVEARDAGQKLLEFIIGLGSESFACSELLQMERICDKLSRMCVAHLTATQQSDIKSFMLHD